MNYEIKHSAYFFNPKIILNTKLVARETIMFKTCAHHMTIQVTQPIYNSLQYRMNRNKYIQEQNILQCYNQNKSVAFSYYLQHYLVLFNRSIYVSLVQKTINYAQTIFVATIANKIETKVIDGNFTENQKLNELTNVNEVLDENILAINPCTTVRILKWNKNEHIVRI